MTRFCGKWVGVGGSRGLGGNHPWGGVFSDLLPVPFGRHSIGQTDSGNVLVLFDTRPSAIGLSNDGYWLLLKCYNDVLSVCKLISKIIYICFGTSCALLFYPYTGRSHYNTKILPSSLYRNTVDKRRFFYPNLNYFQTTFPIFLSVITNDRRNKALSRLKYSELYFSIEQY